MQGHREKPPNTTQTDEQRGGYGRARLSKTGGSRLS
jgi:hypothetical protein